VDNFTLKVLFDFLNQT